MEILKKHTSFGELLRSLREETGHTLKTVAENLQMDTSLLAKIERNERQPTKQIIKLVAAYFAVDEKHVFLMDGGGVMAAALRFLQLGVDLLSTAKGTKQMTPPLLI